MVFELCKKNYNFLLIFIALGILPEAANNQIQNIILFWYNSYFPLY